MAKSRVLLFVVSVCMILKRVISKGIVGCKYFPKATVTIQDLIEFISLCSPRDGLSKDLIKVRRFIIVWDGSDQSLEKSNLATAALDSCDLLVNRLIIGKVTDQ